MNLVQMFCPLATVNMQVWIQETMLVNDGQSILPQTAIRSKVSVDLCLVFGQEQLTTWEGCKTGDVWCVWEAGRADSQSKAIKGVLEKTMEKARGICW